MLLLFHPLVLEIATGKYGYMVDQLVNLSENGRSEEWSRTQEPAKICDTTIAGSLESNYTKIYHSPEVFMTIFLTSFKQQLG